jgi:hypothetical protein
VSSRPPALADIPVVTALVNRVADVDGENLTGAVRSYERVGMSVARRQETLERVAS